jgi:hypothetical protein
LVAVEFGGALNARQSRRLPGLQGRYWFGALASVVVLVAIGLANIVRRSMRWLPLAVLVAAGVVQVFAVSTILGFYRGRPGNALIDRLRALVAWAPAQGEVLALGAAVGTIVLLANVAQLAKLGLHQSSEPELWQRGPAPLARQ